MLPDNLRNYISKFISTEWMAAYNFYPKDILVTEDHPLKGKAVADLKLPKLEVFDMTLTIGQALEMFTANKQEVLPIHENGKVNGVVFEEKLMKALVHKQVPKETLAKTIWDRDFVEVEEKEVDAAIVERLLERFAFVLVKGSDGNTYLANKKAILRALA